MKGIRRYSAFAKIAFRDLMKNRIRFFARFCSYLFFAFVFIELWKLIAREGIIELPYPEADLLWYCSLTQMMLFLSPRLFMVIDDDMRSGNIAYFLNRPIPYLWMRISEGLGAMSAHVLVYYTAGTAALYLYIGEWPSVPSSLLVTLGMLYLGSFLHLLFQMSAGITALWLHDADTLYRIYQKFLIVLGGLYLPLTMYPEWVQGIANFTPFPAMLYAPVSAVLAGNDLNVPETLALLGGWIVFAVCLMYGVFALCMRRIEINGG